MITQHLARLKVSFSSLFLIGILHASFHVLANYTFLVLLSHLFLYLVWLNYFKFIKDLYRKYHLFFLIQVFSISLVGIVPTFFINRSEHYLIDLLMLIGSLMIMLSNYYYSTVDRLKAVGWEVSD